VIRAGGGRLAAIAGAVAVAIVLGASASPANAQTEPVTETELETPPVTVELPKDSILLSVDGVNWVSSVSRGLFDEFQGAVPGDVEKKVFWVKNPLATSANLQIRAFNVWASEVPYSQSVTINGTTDGVSIPAPVSLAELEECEAIVPAIIIPAGEEVRVSLTLEMIDVPLRVAQRASGGFDILVTMYLDGLPHLGNACDPAIAGPAAAGDGNGNRLAFTGAMIAGPLGFSAFLIGLGAMFFIGRRRRREEE